MAPARPRRRPRKGASRARWTCGIDKNIGFANFIFALRSKAAVIPAPRQRDAAPKRGRISARAGKPSLYMRKTFEKRRNAAFDQYARIIVPDAMAAQSLILRTIIPSLRDVVGRKFDDHDALDILGSLENLEARVGDMDLDLDAAERVRNPLRIFDMPLLVAKSWQK